MLIARARAARAGVLMGVLMGVLAAGAARTRAQLMAHCARCAHGMLVPSDAFFFTLWPRILNLVFCTLQADTLW